VPADKYLYDVLDDEYQNFCTSYPENIKRAGGKFVLTNSNNIIGFLDILYPDEQMGELIMYLYFSKAGKIACNVQYEDDGVVYSKGNYNIDAQKGWNKIYLHGYRKDGIIIREYNTKNILTKEKEMKWTLEQRG